MKVLVVGNGARESALLWKLNQSRRLTGLYMAPGNAGSLAIAQPLSCDPLKGDEVAAACRQEGIGLVFIGPEASLEAGVADALSAAGIGVIGPRRHEAQLESSKAFSKAFMDRHGLPTAAARTFTRGQTSEFTAYLKTLSGKIVLKKSGLAAGKGVLETADYDEARAFGLEVLATDDLLIEEYLTGFEISVFGLSDGRTWRVLPPCADFKKAGAGDTGPNTGGMGAICPVPTVGQALWQRVLDDVVAPTYAALDKDGLNYKGVLFFGLMITEQGPKILEYNVRFGDPETQVLIPLLDLDLLDLLQALHEGRLDSLEFRVKPMSACGLVVAAPGYPGAYPKGIPVEALPGNHDSRFVLFHASTVQGSRGLETQGGRCFTAVGLGTDLAEARRHAYARVPELRFEGAWYRPDIGSKFLKD